MRLLRGHVSFRVIDRLQDDGRAWKCTLCYDRLRDDLEPACANRALPIRSSSASLPSFGKKPKRASPSCTSAAFQRRTSTAWIRRTSREPAD